MDRHFCDVGIAVVALVKDARVGGGATFAALVVLSALNLPVALAGLLISVEPLIDMGRTAVNVSGSMTAGTVTSKVLGHSDLAVFTAPDVVPVPATPDARGAGEVAHPAAPKTA